MTMLSRAQQGTLANGMRFVVQPSGAAPICSVCVWYGVGARDEPIGRTGLAHLAEHMMFQGSAHVGPGEHIAYIRDHGGDANGDTTLEHTHYLQTFPSHHLEPVLWLEADRMGTAAETITDERLDNQRAAVVNERAQRYESNVKALAWERAIRLANPEGHPFVHMPAGAVGDLRRITRDDVRAFLNRYYIPTNAVLAVVGDVDVDVVVAQIDRYFGRIEPRSVPRGRPVQPAAPPAPAHAEARASVGSGIALSIYRVASRWDGDFAATDLAVTILGAGRASHLRHVAGPAARSLSFGLLDLGRWPSMAMLEVAAANDIGALTGRIDQTIEEFATTGPTPAQLTIARQIIRRRHLRKQSTVDGRAVDLARALSQQGDAWAGDRLIHRTLTCSAGQVAAAARRLAESRSARLTYLPSTGSIHPRTS